MKYATEYAAMFNESESSPSPRVDALIAKITRRNAGEPQTVRAAAEAAGELASLATQLEQELAAAREECDALRRECARRTPPID